MKYDLENQDLLKICKTASPEELKDLSEDIRSFLIEKVSQTGGHLASNLGIVELTIALMRVFDTPRDKIIYDVGHQAYVHKILTGRAAQFDTLRQYGGMSGFPKSRESAHDAYDTGHSSTSISAAYGMAVARNLAGDDYNVTAVIGDGSFTGGIVFEAMNNIGANHTNVNIILNDNGMSISSNVGALTKYLTKLRSSAKYDEAKVSVKEVLGNVPLIGKGLRSGLKASKEKLRYTLINEEGHIIEDFGIKYYGPVNGFDIESLTEVISAAAKHQGPTLIHVITTKGRGYEWAEKNPSTFHGIGAFDVETGDLISKSNVPSFSRVFGDTICELAEKDEKIVAITAAMGDATGLGPMHNKFPDRFFDVGIAEEHAMVFAAGLAKSGYKPVVAIYSSFLQRAFDFIIEDIALQNLPVIIGVDRAGLVGADGETHHGVFDLSYLSMIPNMTVLAPYDGNQLKEMIEYAAELNAPVAIRYPRGGSVGKISSADLSGWNEAVSVGSDVQILAVGNMLDVALDVTERLAEHNISAGASNVGIIKPVDKRWHDLNTRLVVTLEDNVLGGGFGEAIAAEYVNDDFRILNIAIPDHFVEHGSVDQLRAECRMDPESVTERIIEALNGEDVQKG